MRSRIIALLSIGTCLISAAAPLAASDHYSPEQYRSGDGWHWESQTGLWRNPKARYDKSTKTWIHDTRMPSSTACCDHTGLWVPGDAVNSFDPPEIKKKQRKSSKSARGDAPRGRQDTIEDQVQRIRDLKLSPEVEHGAIYRLRGGLRYLLREELARESYRAKHPVDDARRPGVAYGRVEGEEPNGAGSAASPAYEKVRPYAEPVRTVTEDAEGGSAGPTLSDAGDFLSGALSVATALAPVAGAAANLSAARGASPTTTRTVSSAQARRPPTVYPPGPRFGQSDISGTQ
ncbi:hypothetical protein EKPJFOCH_3445 [Methylobacterium thuringiense]|uniref:Uncharacterized protein n=1 Tax=Methylobacterium thuringiense TaxID=1003091 RepID=A0ABQ4TNH7_9HYPH|nr:hypothetical protein EKPJFOCH_3445 [Methylobacterium thuringiense]